MTTVRMNSERPQPKLQRQGSGLINWLGGQLEAQALDADSGTGLLVRWNPKVGGYIYALAAADLRWLQIILHST